MCTVAFAHPTFAMIPDICFRGYDAAVAGRLAQGIELYSRCLQVVRLKGFDRGQVLYNRAIAYQRSGNIDAAISDYTSAVEFFPADEPSPQYNRAQAYRSKGEFDKALADFTHVIEVAPHHPDGYRGRGLLYSVMGREDKAITDFTKAIDRSSEDAELYYNRGRSFSRLDDYDNALIDLDKALEIDPSLAVAIKLRIAIMVLQRLPK